MSVRNTPRDHDCGCGGVDPGSSGYGADGCRVAGPVAAVRRVQGALHERDLPLLVTWLTGDGTSRRRLTRATGYRPPLVELLLSGPPHQLVLDAAPDRDTALMDVEAATQPTDSSRGGAS